jgi:hypothetical protein
MELDGARVRAMAELVGFEIPQAELGPIAIRLSELLSAMNEIENELGPEMDLVDPVPPVFPREDW